MANEKGKEMEDKTLQELNNLDLLDLALQIYARACSLHCSKEMHERAFDLKDELYKRLNIKQSILGLVDEMIKENDRNIEQLGYKHSFEQRNVALSELKQKIQSL